MQRWVAGQDRVTLVQSTQPKKELVTYDLDGGALRLVKGSIDAGENILALTRDKEWLAKQDAGALAILYGVIFDKLARLGRGVAAAQQQSDANA